MFFILSKILEFLIMPLVWILAILVYALMTRHPKRKNRALLLGLMIAIILSNRYLVNEAFLIWEEAPVAISSLGTHQTAIVLTGITNLDKKSKDQVYFNKGADRLLQTVQLYHDQKISRILISGNSGALHPGNIPEALQLKKVFLFCGIPDSAILIEDKSRNTHENALFSSRLIDSLGIRGPFILVTSAFHMRRAAGCFKKEGIQVQPFPVDYYSVDPRITIKSLIIPSAGALYKWGILIHEWIGLMAYRIMGYS
ncbi:MAG: YdcF family protein [Chitinophagaceae bacterium]